MRNRTKLPVAFAMAGTLVFAAPTGAAPISAGGAALKAAAPSDVVDVRHRGGGAIVGGLALGLIGGALIAGAASGYPYYGYRAPYYGYGYAPAYYGYAPAYYGPPAYYYYGPPRRRYWRRAYWGPGPYWGPRPFYW